MCRCWQLIGEERIRATAQGPHAGRQGDRVAHQVAGRQRGGGRVVDRDIERRASRVGHVTLIKLETAGYAKLKPSETVPILRTLVLLSTIPLLTVS